MTVHDYPPVRVRYFDARGRAQFIRYYLLCRGIPFEDDRVPLSPGFESWRAIREDRTITGPFQKLPVLEWGERTVAETTVIAAFLHRVSGDAALLSEQENLRHEMLLSSVTADLMLPIGILLWSELMFPGADLGATSKSILERMQSQLTVLDKALDEWRWLEQAASRPVMAADCLLWEELDAAQRLFGDKLDVDAAPTVARFYRECAGRETFESLLETKPCPITGRPAEAEALARIHGLLELA